MFSHPAGMHISNLVYELTSKTPRVAEHPWPSASQHAPDAGTERAVPCAVISYQRQDQAACMPCSPTGTSSFLLPKQGWDEQRTPKVVPPIPSSATTKHPAGLRSTGRERLWRARKGAGEEKWKEKAGCAVCSGWARKGAHCCSVLAVCWNQQ